MTTDNTEKVKRGRYTFLINREKGTAWIEAASSGRRKKFALPKSVEIDERTFICESVEAGAFCGNRKLRHLRVPDTYKYLDEDCFICSENLRSVHIGKGLEYYFKWSFSCCPNLERVTIDPDNPYIKISDDGAFVLTKDGKRVLAIIPRRTLKQVIVPEGVEKIESGAISCCDTITKISLPSTLKEIRANGIFENKSLRGLKVPEGVSMLDIQAISYNETLEKIDLPSTCREINYDSLEENSSLKTLVLRSDTIVNVKTGNVGDVMHTCKLYVPEHLVGQYSNHPQWSIMKIESLKYYD